MRGNVVELPGADIQVDLDSVTWVTLGRSGGEEIGVSFGTRRPAIRLRGEAARKLLEKIKEWNAQHPDDQIAIAQHWISIG